MTKLLKHDEWLVYAAFLPVLLTLTGIGVTTVIASHNQALWHVAGAGAIPGGDDDYVQGLARLGIAKLPGYELPSAVELSTPLVAAHEQP